MNTKQLLVISWIITSSIVILTLGFFIVNFRDHEISNDPAHWGEAGDYFGGILNPIISLISLIVLTYISISVTRIEDQRNEFTLQELARPLGQIVCGDYENVIEVKFKNCGLGPLIITDIIVKDKSANISNNIIEKMPILPNQTRWTDFIIDGKNFIVAKDSEINLIKIKSNGSSFQEYARQIRQSLSQLTIEIQYSDIYGRPMQSTTRDLNLFGRTLK